MFEFEKLSTDVFFEHGVVKGDLHHVTIVDAADDGVAVIVAFIHIIEGGDIDSSVVIIGSVISDIVISDVIDDSLRLFRRF